MKFQFMYRVLFILNGRKMVRKVPASLFEFYLEKINYAGGELIDCCPCDIVEA